MCTILLCVTCDQLTYNTRALALSVWLIILPTTELAIVYYIMIKERCFILTGQTYNGFLNYTNKIDEMHKKSMNGIILFKFIA